MVPADQDFYINLQSLKAMGDLEAQSTKSTQPWSYQLFCVLLVTLFSMSALTIYVAIKNSQNTQKIEDLQNLYQGDHFIPEEVATAFLCILAD